MNRRSILVFLGAAMLVAACAASADDGEDDLGSAIEDSAPALLLDGAWVSAPLDGPDTPDAGLRFRFRHAVEGDSFVGRAEGLPALVAGTFAVGADKLGATLTLTPKTVTLDPSPAAAGDDDDGSDADADADADASGADEASARKAFRISMHLLRIGKNDTLLLRADGPTTQYRKVASWCETDDACDGGAGPPP